MNLFWWTCGGTPRPHLKGRADREDILVVIGLAQARAKQPFSCEVCQNCSMPSRDYESGYWEPGECAARPALANLKTFPFKRVPHSCHERGHFALNYWASAFAHLYYDGKDDEDRLTLRLWRMADRLGNVNLNERNQKRVDAALDRFMARKGALITFMFQKKGANRHKERDLAEGASI